MPIVWVLALAKMFLYIIRASFWWICIEIPFYILSLCLARYKGGIFARTHASNIRRGISSRFGQCVCDVWCEACKMVECERWHVGLKICELIVIWRRRAYANHVVGCVWSGKWSFTFWWTVSIKNSFQSQLIKKQFDIKSWFGIRDSVLHVYQLNLILVLR